MSETVYNPDINTILNDNPDIKQDFENTNITSQGLYDFYNKRLELANDYLVKVPKLKQDIETANATLNEYKAIQQLHWNSKEYRNFKNETGLDRKGLENKINKLKGSIQQMNNDLKQYEGLNETEAKHRQSVYTPIVNYLKGITDYIDSKKDVYDSYMKTLDKAKRMNEIINNFDVSPLGLSFGVSPQFTISEELKSESPKRTLESNKTLYEETIPNETKRMNEFINREPEYVEQIKQNNLTIDIVPPTKSSKATKAYSTVLVPIPQSAKTLEELNEAYIKVSKSDYKQFKKVLKTLPHDEPNDDNKDIINRTDYVLKVHPVFSTLTDELSLIKPLLRSSESVAYDAIQNQYITNKEQSLEPNDRAYIEQKHRWLESPQMQKYRKAIMEGLISEATEVNRLIDSIGHNTGDTLPDSTIELINKSSKADDNIKHILEDVLSSNSIKSWEDVKNTLKRSSPEFYKEMYVDKHGNEWLNFDYNSVVDNWKSIYKELNEIDKTKAKTFKTEVQNLIGINKHSPIFNTLVDRLTPFKQKTLARNYIRGGMNSQEAIIKAKSNIESLGKKQDVKIDSTIKETSIKEPSNRQSRIRYMRRQAADIGGSKSQQYVNSSYKKINEEERKLVQNMRRTLTSKREEVNFTKLMMLQAHQRQTHKDMDYQPVQLTSEEYIRS